MTWPTTVVATGDLITAAQLSQLPIALAKAEGAAASYDFQSIPAVWSHLLLVAALQTNSGNNRDELGLRFNNDSGARYYRQRVDGTGATAQATESLAATSMTIAQVGGKTAGGLSPVIIWIPNYLETGTGARRCAMAMNGVMAGTTTGLLSATTDSGFWDETVTPINRVTLTPAAGSFSATSSCYLYVLGVL